MRRLINNLVSIPNGQKYRYLLIIISCLLFFAPFTFIPSLAGNGDLCGKLCMRRFYLFFPGMDGNDLWNQITVAYIGVTVFAAILTSTLFFGRMWCSYICPVGGFPELVSRTLNDRWKIEFRALPQVPIRYGYFTLFVVAMPVLGISACTLCNFITVPRLFEAISGGIAGVGFLFSAVGLVNLLLLFLLGFFASKGRAYCQFLCPIGAVDGLVNRLGAYFRFTRRIRVERSRCTGCNNCARACMTGAIRMVDQIAVVDQLSCMSCHECVDVCDWGAIDWRAAPADRHPKRKKKGIDFHPQPVWHAIHVLPPKVKSCGRKKINWQQVILAVIFSVAALFMVVTSVQAVERHPDPDGCLACHALEGLDFIDEDGLLRSASIDRVHYFSSLHGSVPCKDCHRKVRDYPHKVENGEVDCGDSCHVEEPSGGEPYTHKPVIDEYRDSAHGEGWSKGLTGGNRLQEARKESNPSCRKCHSNELYIGKEELPKFKQEFAHIETDCGNCHQGKVWLNRFGGHLLRRFVGSRWNRRDHNAICNECHADQAFMAQVEIEDEAGKKQKAGPRFILASESYKTTLHSRLLESGVEEGASCIDCHAPGGLKHAVRRDENPLASTSRNRLAKTCAAEQCHGFATHPLNGEFVKTDLHDIDMARIDSEIVAQDSARLESNWTRALIALLPILAIIGAGSLLWLLFGDKKKRGVTFAVLGGDSFQEKVIVRTPKSKARKASHSGKRRKS